MFSFVLGREYKLSIAEIFAVFPEGKAVFFDKEFLILEGIEEKKVLGKANTLGGTIKIIKIGDFDIIEDALKHEGKFKYGISIFGNKKNLKEVLNKSKNDLKKNNISSRFVNKDFKNLTSAQIIGEKLVKLGTDYNFFYMSFGGKSDSKFNLLENSDNEDYGHFIDPESRITDFLLIPVPHPNPSPLGEGEATNPAGHGSGGHLQNDTKFGKTIWIQDINSYSKRDFEKDRDMKIGMLPPKLAQIMINLGNSPLKDNTFLHSIDIDSHQYDINQNSIFDPFVGLGTILIEASLIGYKNLYGSDLNEKMVEYSKKNLENFLKSYNNKDYWHLIDSESRITDFLLIPIPHPNPSPLGEGEATNPVGHGSEGHLRNNIVHKVGFEKLNAKFIDESKFIAKTNLIVTEGYLGEIMTNKNISIDRINKQKESLKLLYENFFAGLKKVNYSGNIVISFPFWELSGRYIYLDEIYEIIEKYCIVEKLFPNNFENLSTKVGSLLYKRENQLVGREIFKLIIKV